MERTISQIMDCACELKVPVVIAGDIFDRWNAPAELINFAIRQLTVYHPDNVTRVPVYAVPGQHDLPFHNYDDIRKSAYWTLVESGAIIDLQAGTAYHHDGEELVLHPFPWGHAVEPNQKVFKSFPNSIHLAVIHQYLWESESNSYTGAPVEKKLSSMKKRFYGYHAAVVGDNHKGWYKSFPDFRVGAGLDPDTQVLNCGTLIRRKSDEQDYQPQFGILYSDGSIEPQDVYCDQDQFLDAKDFVRLVDKAGTDLAAFVEGLNSLQDSESDFFEVLRRTLSDKKVRDEVRRAVLETIEEVR